MSDNNKQTGQQRPDDREQQAQSGPGDATPRVPGPQGEMEQYKQEHGDVNDGTDDAGSSGQWPEFESGQDISILRASRPVETTAIEVAPGGDPAAPDLSLVKLALERLDSLKRGIGRFRREGQELQEASARLVEESASIDSRASRIIQEFEEGGPRPSTFNELCDYRLRRVGTIGKLLDIADRQNVILEEQRELFRQSRARAARVEELEDELNTARIQLNEAVNRRRDI
ncbi:hypothetical protein NW752_008523 [Fusarium irregulare]|uniref:Uncharacterized protein n=1 Tax=Fusarium irregulare TaxID=2494466 RepID=A0A9W8PY43_9HYPO|nr:hypothetical protein NW752_008523 [Fusarium irregulare]KAJ4020454.1 hypothetical protein NW766_001939 [Fusarium irregulare]